MEKVETPTQKIVFFDGECSLCNGFVDALITRDKAHILQYASLQGETAKKLLSPQDRDNLETVIYFEAGKTYSRSSAILRILWRLGGPYKASVVGWIVPSFIRDTVYKWVAKNRYAWFGKRDTCRIPTPEERSYLLP